MLTNEYQIGSRIKLVFLFLENKPFVGNMPIEYFIGEITHGRLNISTVEFDLVEVTVEEKIAHNKKDFGYKAIMEDQTGIAYCQYEEHKKQTLYELGMIPLNDYDYLWAFKDSSKSKRRYVEYNYLLKVLSQYGKTFKPLIYRLKKSQLG